jgi:hypothetical protein
VVVPVISSRIVKKHLTPDVKAVNTAAGVLKTIHNAHLKQVKKAERIVTAEAVSLINPDRNNVLSIYF